VTEPIDVNRRHIRHPDATIQPRKRRAIAIAAAMRSVPNDYLYPVGV
jgi:hypothetical protein